MTGNRCLLDTSVIINFLRGNDHTIKQLYTFSEIFIPSIAIGELYYGAYRSANIPKHLQQLSQFIQDYTILTPDLAIANSYGSIKAGLKSIGKPIPENDMWIAATAVHYELPLFTTDKHFSLIIDLILV